MPRDDGTAVPDVHAGEAGEQQHSSHPLTDRQKRALWAAVAVGTVAVVPVLRMLPDLLCDEKGV